MAENRSSMAVSIGSLIVAVLALTLTFFNPFKQLVIPLIPTAPAVVGQMYESNILINVDFPRLERVNSWQDPNVRTFFEKPLFHDEKTNEPVYQAQFSVSGAPEKYNARVFIFKRNVSRGGQNTWEQHCEQIPMVMAADKKESLPIDVGLFKVDIVKVNEDPTTLIICVTDKKGSIIKSSFFHIEG